VFFSFGKADNILIKEYLTKGNIIEKIE